MEAPQAEPLVAPAAPQDDLSKYDSRRALARVVDGVFVGAPFLVPVLGLGFALSIALVAVSLLYFFLCEALWGQTLGKRLLGVRVLTRDGRAASAKAVALRTVTRIVEDGPIGLAVFLASGKRRARFGDLLGDTIVARPAPGLPRAGFSPLLIVFPAAIAAVGVAVVLAFSGHFARQDYLSAVDKTCKDNAAAAVSSPPHGLDDILARTAADHRRLAAVKAPGSARKLRAEILALDGNVDRAVETAAAHAKAASGEPLRTAIKPIAVARQTAAKRYAQLGLGSCAGLRSA